MKTHSFYLWPALILFSTFPPVVTAQTTDTKAADSTPFIAPAPKPTPQPPPPKAKTSQNLNTGKTLVIHKPMPDPSWGKVIQYHRDQVLALSEKNREITHEFLFQDDSGVIRTAIFHENSSGDGYWEVWVWDQP